MKAIELKADDVVNGEHITKLIIIASVTPTHETRGLGLVLTEIVLCEVETRIYDDYGFVASNKQTRWFYGDEEVRM
jgi:hypothetical protein